MVAVVITATIFFALFYAERLSLIFPDSVLLSGLFLQPLVAEIRKNYLYISVKNTLPDVAVAKNQRIPDLERGLGTKILNNLAEKYFGDYKAEIADGIFYSSILLNTFDNTLQV